MYSFFFSGRMSCNQVRTRFSFLKRNRKTKIELCAFFIISLGCPLLTNCIPYIDWGSDAKNNILFFLHFSRYILDPSCVIHHSLFYLRWFILNLSLREFVFCKKKNARARIDPKDQVRISSSFTKGISFLFLFFSAFSFFLACVIKEHDHVKYVKSSYPSSSRSFLRNTAVLRPDSWLRMRTVADWWKVPPRKTWSRIQAPWTNRRFFFLFFSTLTHLKPDFQGFPLATRNARARPPYKISGENVIA